MTSTLASSVVDRGFEPRSDQAKDYKVGICCLSSKYVYSIKEWEQTLVSSESELHENYQDPIKRVQANTTIVISSNITCCEIVHLALNNNTLTYITRK